MVDTAIFSIYHRASRAAAPPSSEPPTPAAPVARNEPPEMAPESVPIALANPPPAAPQPEPELALHAPARTAPSPEPEPAALHEPAPIAPPPEPEPAVLHEPAPIAPPPEPEPAALHEPAPVAPPPEPEPAALHEPAPVAPPPEPEPAALLEPAPIAPPPEPEPAALYEPAPVAPPPEPEAAALHEPAPVAPPPESEPAALYEPAPTAPPPELDPAALHEPPPVASLAEPDLATPDTSLPEAEMAPREPPTPPPAPLVSKRDEPLWVGPASLVGVPAGADQLGLANPVIITLLARLNDSAAIALDASRSGLYRPPNFRAAPWSGFAYDQAQDGQTGVAAGTRILTSRGEMEVEKLLPGDTALTLRAPALLPIAWIGKSHTAASPVLIEAGALGPNLPRRPLRLAPNQAVYVDPVPVPAIRLVNGTTIRTLDDTGVELFHVDVGTSEILFAEGVPVSSSDRQRVLAA